MDRGAQQGDVRPRETSEGKSFTGTEKNFQYICKKWHEKGEEISAAEQIPGTRDEKKDREKR